jgi:hypothetical protein
MGGVTLLYPRPGGAEGPPDQGRAVSRRDLRSEGQSGIPPSPYKRLKNGKTSKPRLKKILWGNSVMVTEMNRRFQSYESQDDGGRKTG